MSAHPDDLYKLIDLAADQARRILSELQTLRAQLATLNLPEPKQHLCPECGLDMRGPKRLAQHLYVMHDGPEPTPWVEAEQRAAP